MALEQRTTLFDQPRKPHDAGRSLPSGKEEIRNTITGPDFEIRTMLADYLNRFSADESIIEAKGKLIRYIRSI